MRPNRSLRIPPIPHDLVIYILGYLSESKETLSSCSLVCRAWRDATQPSFFKIISLTTSDRLSYLENLLASDSSFAPWIHELQIDTRVNGGPLIDPDSWLYRLSESLSNELVNLRHFHLRHLYESGRSAPATTSAPQTHNRNTSRDTVLAHLGAFSSVTKVTLEDAHLTSHTLFEMLSSFPHLDDLHIRNFHRAESTASLQSPLITNKLSLKSIHVYMRLNPYDMTSQLFRWLATTNTVRTLRHATIHGVGDVTARGAANFLADMTALESLDFMFAPEGSVRGAENFGSSMAEHFDFSSNTQLQEVTLRNPHDPLTVDFLEKLSVTNVHSLRMFVRSHPDPQNELAVLGALDICFRPGTFRMLREIVLVCPEQWVSELERHGATFPAAERRGILRRIVIPT